MARCRAQGKEKQSKYHREGSAGVRRHITICAPRGDVGICLSTKRTAQSAWEGIKSRRVGVQRVRESNIEQLRKELSEIRFKDAESVDDFSMRITGLANSITTLDGSISETKIVKKMLQVVPDHLEQVAISIETLLDVNDLTVEEVTGRLRNVE